MDENSVKALVAKVVAQLLKQEEGENKIPVEVSARHVHLCQADVEALFGKGHTLTLARELSQPGQFLAKERLSIVTGKGELRGVAVLGPARSKTQVELSATDSRQIGVKAPLRTSGDTIGAPDVFLFSSTASVCAREAVIVAQNHIHMKGSHAAEYGVADGEVVSVTMNTARPITFENVVVRISEGFDLAMHIDSDEAGACMFENGDRGILVKKGSGASVPIAKAPAPEEFPYKQHSHNGNMNPLIETQGVLETGKTTEDHPVCALSPGVLTAEKAAELSKDCLAGVLALTKGTIVTPLARDVLRGKKIQIQME